jgi:hypothetical protein
MNGNESLEKYVGLPIVKAISCRVLFIQNDGQRPELW